MKDDIRVKEISTLEEVTSYLNELQAGASYSLETTIKAQLEIIRFVQSPTLVSTTLDSLILFLKRSLEEAESPREQNALKDQFSLMIQNYIFFFNARLQLEINTNKDEATKLFHQAGEMLSKTITDISLMSIPGGQSKGGKAVVGVVVKNFFSKDDNKSKGFLTSLINWWRKDKIIAEKRSEFYKTLDSMFFKLDKYSDLIGTSLLINGVILNYISELSDYYFDYDLYNIEEQIKEFENKIDEQPILFSKGETTGAVFGIGIVTILLRWIWTLLASFGTAIVDVFSDEKSISSNEGWFLPHFLWVLGITVVVELFFVIRSVSIRSDYAQIIKNKEIKYNNMLSEKQQYVNQLKTIAEKFQL